MTPAVLLQTQWQRTDYRRTDGNIRVGSDTDVTVMGAAGDGNQIVRLTGCFSEKMLEGLGEIQEEQQLRCCRQIKEEQRGE